MQHLSEYITLDALIRENDILLVEFGSRDCAPCGAISEKIDEYMSQHDEVNAIYVEIDDHLAMCSGYGVFTSPTLYVFVRGQLTIKESGYFGLSDIFDRVSRYVDLIS